MQENPAAEHRGRTRHIAGHPSHAVSAARSRHPLPATRPLPAYLHVSLQQRARA